MCLSDYWLSTQRKRNQYTYADFRHRLRITSLQSTLPKKLINMEVPKRDVHGPLEKERVSRLGAQEEGGGS